LISLDIQNDAQVQKQVQGLIAAFGRLPRDLAKKRMRAAIRKATKPFEPALQGNTPYLTGSLIRSIKTKIKVYDKGTHGNVVFVCGYARGSLKKKRGLFVVSGSGSHAIIVENGSKLRRRKSGGSTGIMPARRMAKRTLDATRQSILSSLVTELAAALERTAKEVGSNAVS
jgi:HK97 gp10 family phage protein